MEWICRYNTATRSLNYRIKRRQLLELIKSNIRLLLCHLRPQTMILVGYHHLYLCVSGIKP